MRVCQLQLLQQNPRRGRGWHLALMVLEAGVQDRGSWGAASWLVVAPSSPVSSPGGKRSLVSLLQGHGPHRALPLPDLHSRAWQGLMLTATPRGLRARPPSGHTRTGHARAVDVRFAWPLLFVLLLCYLFCSKPETSPTEGPVRGARDLGIKPPSLGSPRRGTERGRPPGTAASAPPASVAVGPPASAHGQLPADTHQPRRPVSPGNIVRLGRNW